MDSDVDEKDESLKCPPTDCDQTFVPDGYRMTKAGLFWIDSKDSDNSLLLSGPFKALAETRNDHSEAWGLLIEWHDNDNRRHQWAVPKILLAGDGSDLRARLMNGGFSISPNRKARELFAAYLGTIRSRNRVRCVDKIGWHKDAYVMPDQIFGCLNDDERPMLQIIGRPPEFLITGSLEGWQATIARYAIGNSRLAFAIAVSFSGPLLRIIDEESFGFNITGGSSSGKTTALRVASSVWGSPVRTWRTTDNGSEAWAQESNDGCLVIDELSQVDGRMADAMTYMLGNGQGKKRMDKNSIGRSVSAWRLVFLSSGEIGISEKLAEVGRKSRAGISVRMVEIPSDTGSGHKIFEILHGFENGDALSRHLRSAVMEQNGNPIRSFLEKITVVSDIREKIATCRNQWLKDNLPPNPDGQVSRVAANFALVAAAGSLASALGILPWPPQEAENAAAICFRAWLAQRGGPEAAEIMTGIEQVRSFIGAHGMSRFTIINHDNDAIEDSRITNRVGYRKKDGKGRWEYLIFADAWKNEVCKGLDAKLVARAMAEKGFLEPGKGSLSKQAKLPGLGNTRVYYVRADLLDEGSNIYAAVNAGSSLSGDDSAT